MRGCVRLCKAVQGCAPVLCPWGIANYPFSKLLFILWEFSLGIMGIFTRNIIQAWHPRGTDLNRPRLLEWDYPLMSFENLSQNLRVEVKKCKREHKKNMHIKKISPIKFSCSNPFPTHPQPAFGRRVREVRLAKRLKVSTDRSQTWALRRGRLLRISVEVGNIVVEGSSRS